MSDKQRPWEAVEVGVDEMFLGQREGETSGDGYSPFYDMGDVPRDLAERIAACLNACSGIPTERLRPGIVKDAIDFCEAHVRFMDGSTNAMCGMEKIARSVAKPSMYKVESIAPEQPDAKA